MKKITIRFFQLLILLAIRITYAGRVKVDTKGLQKISGPIVIASNHAHSLDPFIIACFLPLKNIFRIYPYAFMTANVYYHRWWKPLAFLEGCYPAKQLHENESPVRYGVGRSVKLLEQGYSVVMFPEGRRTTKRLKAKPGISRILQNYQTPLLLCRINWSKSGQRKLISLSCQPAGTSVDPDSPDSIMKAVYALPLPRESSLDRKRA